MAQYKALAPGVEVNGETVLSVIDGMGSFKAQAVKILAENGISHPQPGHWYLQQAWLNAFKFIAEKIGPNTLYTIGRKIPENARFPPDIDTIGKGLSAIDVAYHMNHRGGEIGSYKLTDISHRSATMICNNPYPCDFDWGIIEAIARKFKPAESLLVMVKHDDSAPCRKKGASSCSYLISW